MMEQKQIPTIGTALGRRVQPWALLFTYREIVDGEDRRDMRSLQRRQTIASFELISG